MWRRLLFDVLYRIGRPVWDTPTPDELRAAIEGENALPPGRALDLGCGTSTNVIYLARHGWDATGVDFSAKAIRLATQKAEGVPGATFVVADVTELAKSGISGPFDLAVDNGCYHTLAADQKSAYVREVAAVMKPGAPLMMWEGIRMRPDDIPNRFGNDFIVERVHEKNFTIDRLARRFSVKGSWYSLRRR